MFRRPTRRRALASLCGGLAGMVAGCLSLGGLQRGERLTPADGESGDAFGYDVALAGDRMLVGARGTDRADVTDAGVAHVYARADGTWAQRATLTAENGAAGDGFGSSVALADGRALVGDGPGSATLFEL